MRRRNVIGGLAGGMISSALPAAAQQRPQLPVVALVLGSAPEKAMAGDAPAVPFVRAFVERLRDLGWIEGRSITLLRRSAEGVPERAAGIFAELVASGVDVLAVGGEAWLLDAALAATRTIPIVANLRDDPVAAGLIDNLAKPGGNLTGVMEATGPDFDGKRLQLLSEYAPRVTRVAYLAARRKWEQFRDAPRPPRVTVFPAILEVAGGLKEAFDAILRERADGLMVAADGPSYFEAPRIIDFAALHRLPAIYGYREPVTAGGAMAYGSSVRSRFRQVASLVDRFLRGARLGEVPVVRPTTFEFVINIKTTRELGLDIPSSLLARVDEVIE